LSYFLSLSRAVKKKEVFEEISSLFHLAVNRAKKRLKDKIYYFEKKKVVFLYPLDFTPTGTYHIIQRKRALTRWKRL